VKSVRAQGRMWSDVCCGAVIGIDTQEASTDTRCRSSVLIRTVASVANLEFVVSCNLPEPNPIRDKRRSSW
jgi:hypothetical protein